MNIDILKTSTFLILIAAQMAFANGNLNDKNLILEDIIYLEEETASLNFDTDAYLPEDFNPYAGPVNVLHVSYIEEAEEIDLGFDTKEYLPEGFNPYQCDFDLNSIEYMDENDLFELDFDTQKYLPVNFNASIGR